jgi:colanic acid/amylovoran biosynthesis glycosyltransferase
MDLIVRRHRPRLLHLHFGYAIRNVLGPARRHRLPVVVSLFGHDVTGLLAGQPDFYRGTLDRADAVIVPSQFLAERAIQAGARSDVVHVIAFGVDLDRFRPTPPPTGAPELVFVGRFVEKKGVDVLLDAWPHVRRAHPDARLRLLGFGPLEPPAGSTPEGVEVVRAPAPDEVRDAIGNAAVVVQPSRTAADGDAESLLLVNLEAQAAGRPVVSTLHAAVPEFVRHGETGLLVPENDPIALAEAVNRLLGDPGLAHRMGEAGARWARRFDAGDGAARVDAVYDALGA